MNSPHTLYFGVRYYPSLFLSRKVSYGCSWANLLHRACFRNNLLNRVSFKTYYRQDLLWMWMPPLLPAEKLVPPLATAALMHTAIPSGGTWWVGERWPPIPPFVLAGHDWRGEREPCRHSSWRDMPTWQSRHCLLRNTLTGRDLQACSDEKIGRLAVRVCSSEKPIACER